MRIVNKIVDNNSYATVYWIQSKERFAVITAEGDRWEYLTQEQAEEVATEWLMGEEKCQKPTQNYQ